MELLLAAQPMAVVVAEEYIRTIISTVYCRVDTGKLETVGQAELVEAEQVRLNLPAVSVLLLLVLQILVAAVAAELRVIVEDLEVAVK